MTDDKPQGHGFNINKGSWSQSYHEEFQRFDEFHQGKEQEMTEVTEVTEYEEDQQLQYEMADESKEYQQTQNPILRASSPLT